MQFADKIVKALQPRDLRKVLATFGYGAGIDFLHINLLEGHSLSSVQLVSATAEKHYVKSAFLKEKRAAMEKWDRWLRRGVIGTPVSAEVVPISSTVQPPNLR